MHYVCPLRARCLPGSNRLLACVFALCFLPFASFAADATPAATPPPSLPPATPDSPDSPDSTDSTGTPDSAADRIHHLEEAVQELRGQVRQLQQSSAPAAGSSAQSANSASAPAWREHLDFGMYGELLANLHEGSGPDTLEVARLVFFAGYEFADWIHFNSEVEIEHAFVENAQGELNVEQCYFDFMLDPTCNLRAGRFLAPVSAMNLRHEPLSFNGVIRPAFDTYIVPTTWSVDGMEAFGTILPEVAYQVGLVSGLAGNGITPLEGPEEARQEHIASLHQMAVAARLEFTPLVRASVDAGHLRFGFSTFQGGLNNGDEGADPGLHASMALYEGDFEYNVGFLDLRAAVGQMQLYRAMNLPAGVASELFGWRAEAAVHCLPTALQTGKLAHSDVIVFVRFDAFNTQYRMPTGVARDPAGDRTEWTVGVTWKLTGNVALKADYQWLDDATATPLEDQLNFGLVWSL